MHMKTDSGIWLLCHIAPQDKNKVQREANNLGFLLCSDNTEGGVKDFSKKQEYLYLRSQPVPAGGCMHTHPQRSQLPCTCDTLLIFTPPTHPVRFHYL